MKSQALRFYAKKYAPEILTGVGVGGQVVSNLMFVRAEKLYLADGKKSHFLWPSLVSLGSIAAIIGSNRLSSTQKISLTAATAALATKYTTDRKNFKENNSEEDLTRIDLKRFVEEADKADDVPWDDDDADKKVFYIEDYGIIFVSSISNVMRAEQSLNETFVHEGVATMLDFFNYLGIPVNDFDRDLYSEIGWRYNFENANEGMQYISINNYMKLVPFEGKDVECHYIDFNEEALPMNEWSRVYEGKLDG